MRIKTPILMYHHVEKLPLVPEPVNRESYIAREQFARQLDRIRRFGLKAVTLADALESASAGRPAGRRIVLTFDDGCSCFAEHALAELVERGMSATVFAVSGRLGDTNRWDDRFGERTERLMTGAQLRDLAARGFEIGSHTVGHPDLTQCEPAQLSRELRRSKSDLEELTGSRVTSLCYPYGHLDSAAVRAAQSAGYLGAVGIQGLCGTGFEDRFRLARMVIRPGESRVEFLLKIAGLYPAVSRLPRLGLLQALRGKEPLR